MIRQEIIDALKDRTEEYIFSTRQLNITSNKNINCLDPGHDDKNPSMHYYSNSKRFYCHGCGAKLDLFDIIGIDYNISDFKEQVKKACELFNINYEETGVNIPANKQKQEEKKQPAQANKTSESMITLIEEHQGKEQTRETIQKSVTDEQSGGKLTQYLVSRGIAQDMAKKLINDYSLMFNDTLGFNNEFLMILSDDKTTYNARNLDTNSKYRYRTGYKKFIFNEKALDKDNEIIFITEGEIDALTLISLGMQAVALSGVNNKDKLIDKIKNTKNTHIYVMAFDNDDTGKRESRKLERAIRELDKVCYTLDIPAGNKDVNEAIQNDMEQLVDNVLQAYSKASDCLRIIEYTKQEEHKEALKEYEKESCLGYLKEFKEHIKQPRKDYYKTGFNKLDECLGGGLFAGLYVLGAVSSLGKTTFALQLLDQVARNGNDCIFFSLEQSRRELMGKTISRLTYEIAGKDRASMLKQISVYNTYKNLVDAQKKVIEEAFLDYEQFARNITIHEAQGQITVKTIRSEVEKHIKIRNKKPFIIIDYLQIIAPADMQNEKRSIDYNVTALRQIARDFNIPVLVISSFNRDSYNNKPTLSSFKESGGIEYSADVLMGLYYTNINNTSFDLEDERKKEEINISLSIIKNRNGQTGKTEFKFTPAFNNFKGK